MENEHKYRVTAWWTSGQTGITKSDSAPNAIHFTAPPQFGGLEGRWTPEDLLMGSLASCFTTTFHVLAGHTKFEYTDLSVEAEGIVGKAKGGYSFNQIALRTKLKISDAKLRAQGVRLLDKAKALCLVSRALAIEQKFEARVEIESHSYQSEGGALPAC